MATTASTCPHFRTTRLAASRAKVPGRHLLRHAVLPFLLCTPETTIASFCVAVRSPASRAAPAAGFPASSVHEAKRPLPGRGFSRRRRALPYSRCAADTRAAAEPPPVTAQALAPQGPQQPPQAAAKPDAVAPTSSGKWREDEGPPPGAPPTPPYRLITGLSAAGAAETAYLAYEKLTGGPVACPLGGCSDVLDSPWGTLFGLPLALYGCAAYSSIAILAQAARITAGGSGGSGGGAARGGAARWLLLAAATVAASVSAYLVFILASQFEGTTCLFCLASAGLSAALLACILRGFEWEELQQALAPQAALSAAVLIGLNVVFADARSALAGPADIDLPPIEPVVSTSSSAPTVALAKHLKAIGAKMYGAFWCSHCYEQKQMFGQEAMKYVPYVECYPEGYRRGVTIDKQCTDASIQGFPTWVVQGQMLAGEQDLDALSLAAGFDPNKPAKGAK